MADIGRLYLYMFLICFLFVAPGLAHADKPWVPPKEKATKAEEKQIFQGCALKAEYVFYIAQEKVYNHGNTEKLMTFLLDNMSQAEFAVQGKLMEWLSQWVDSHDYKQPSEYARAIFYECVANSYQHFGKEPTKQAMKYLQRFEENLESVEERPLPKSGDEVEA